MRNEITQNVTIFTIIDLPSIHPITGVIIEYTEFTNINEHRK